MNPFRIPSLTSLSQNEQIRNPENQVAETQPDEVPILGMLNNEDNLHSSRSINQSTPYRIGYHLNSRDGNLPATNRFMSLVDLSDDEVSNNEDYQAYRQNISNNSNNPFLVDIQAVPSFQSQDNYTYNDSISDANSATFAKYGNVTQREYLFMNGSSEFSEEYEHIEYLYGVSPDSNEMERIFSHSPFSAVSENNQETTPPPPPSLISSDNLSGTQREIVRREVTYKTFSRVYKYSVSAPPAYTPDLDNNPELELLLQEEYHELVQTRIASGRNENRVQETQRILWHYIEEDEPHFVDAPQQVRDMVTFSSTDDIEFLLDQENPHTINVRHLIIAKVPLNIFPNRRAIYNGVIYTLANQGFSSQESVAGDDELSDESVVATNKPFLDDIDHGMRFVFNRSHCYITNSHDTHAKLVLDKSYYENRINIKSKKFLNSIFDFLKEQGDNSETVGIYLVEFSIENLSKNLDDSLVISYRSGDVQA